MPDTVTRTLRATDSPSKLLVNLIEDLRNGLASLYPRNGEFNIPPFDYQEFTYVGSTNNVATRVFKSGGASGTTVATLTYTYVAAGAADDDDVASITQT